MPPQPGGQLLDLRRTSKWRIVASVQCVPIGVDRHPLVPREDVEVEVRMVLSHQGEMYSRDSVDRLQ
jgi:hypothetical protein